MTTRTLAVVSAGIGQPSSTRLLADRLADATVTALGRHGVDEPSVRTIELRDHAHDLTNNLLTFFASEPLQEVKELLARADGVIAVTPIFSASYNGLFKTFFDLLEQDALAGTPVLLGATAGTARHSLALEHTMRPLFAYLKAVTIPTAVFAAAEDWGAGRAVDGGLSARIERAADELAMHLAAREPTAPVDPYAVTTPFDQLRRIG